LVAVNVNAAIPVEKVEAPVKNQSNNENAGHQDKIGNFYEYLHKLNPLKHESKFGYFDVINKTISLITYRTCQLSLEKYSPDILVNISHECCSTFDFDRGAEMVELGRQAANKALESYFNKAN
jgi:NTE family protein